MHLQCASDHTGCPGLGLSASTMELLHKAATRDGEGYAMGWEVGRRHDVWGNKVFVLVAVCSTSLCYLWSTQTQTLTLYLPLYVYVYPYLYLCRCATLLHLLSTLSLSHGVCESCVVHQVLGGVLWHFGTNFWFTSLVWLCPRRQLMVTACVNWGNSAARLALHRVIENILALLPAPEPDPVVLALLATAPSKVQETVEANRPSTTDVEQLLSPENSSLLAGVIRPSHI